MKAAISAAYGPPEVVRVVEVDRPEAGEHEVLVKVAATTVNRSDCGYRAAKPFTLTVLHRDSEAQADAQASGNSVVTVVCSTEHVALVNRLGADRVIDRPYPLDEIVEACRYVETGQKTGDVVITVGTG